MFQDKQIRECGLHGEDSSQAQEDLKQMDKKVFIVVFLCVFKHTKSTVKICVFSKKNQLAWCQQYLEEST